MTAAHETDIPLAVQGAWQRVALSRRGQAAEGPSRTFWIQTPTLQASLSLPALRPETLGKSAFHDYSAAELLLLARQEGIAGMTLVGEGLLHRRRQIDFQPTRGRDNTQRIRFENGFLIEENLQGSAAATWQKIGDSQDGIITLRMLEEARRGRHPVTRKGYLLVMGGYFLFVRDRAGFTRQASSLTDLFEAEDADHAAMASYLDCEFSFGQRFGNPPWTIHHSTLPWREGHVLFPPGQFETLRAGGLALVQQGRDSHGRVTRRWSIDTWEES